MPNPSKKFPGTKWAQQGTKSQAANRALCTALVTFWILLVASDCDYSSRAYERLTGDRVNELSEEAKPLGSLDSQSI